MITGRAAREGDQWRVVLYVPDDPDNPDYYHQEIVLLDGWEAQTQAEAVELAIYQLKLR
jgi:hypothetical protein